jgi:predicted nucleic acid-binding protein
LLVLAALLDTNVLWPSLCRDFLLSLAIEGLYRPLWSEVILEESRVHEQAKLERRGIRRGDAQRRSEGLGRAMRRAFPEALVEGWERLEGSFKLPDQDDEHVVAAAVIGRAGVIVTENAKDFLLDRIPDDLRILSAAEFASRAVALGPTAARHALEAMSARYTAPPLLPSEIVDRLELRYGMWEAAAVIRAGAGADLSPGRRR